MKIVIAAGGTGGHLYPGIAVARALKGHEILFVVRRGDMGREILQKEGFAVREISGQGLPRTFSLKLFTFPLKLVAGWVETNAVLNEFHPDAVLGMGGYLSVPVLLCAKKRGIRTLLHEQNVYPGLANRFLSHWVDSVALSFESSRRYFKTNNLWVSGLPIRPDMDRGNKVTALRQFDLQNGIQTILVFGGSLGAERINTLAPQAWGILLKQHIQFQVIHITGQKDFDRTKALYAALDVAAQVMPFCHDMGSAYAACDAVISRSGASTVAELLILERPALLIPYPYASNNHQLYNARLMEEAGQARVLLDRDLTPEAIVQFVTDLPTFQTPSQPKTQDSHHAASKLSAFLIEQRL